VQSNQNQTGTGNESYEERERRDLLQRITDFYLRFAYVPMFFGEPGQAAPAKRPETVVQKSKPKPITEETPLQLDRAGNGDECQPLDGRSLEKTRLRL
jgi:hypothetical protein